MTPFYKSKTFYFGLLLAVAGYALPVIQADATLPPWALSAAGLATIVLRQFTAGGLSLTNKS